MTSSPRILRIALDPALGTDVDEAWYVLRVLTRIAGYGVRRASGAETGEAEVYYGPRPEASGASVRIRRGASTFAAASSTAPVALDDSGPGPASLWFAGEERLMREPRASEVVDWDLVFAAFWLLTGAAEAGMGRDSRDNLAVTGSAAERLGLLRRPLVSEWGGWLRTHFESAGIAAAPWRAPGGPAALVLTHDVDYPEILRAIETCRALASGRPRLAWAVASGAVDYWRFDDWMALSETLGGRSTFFFMARKGSLWEYLRGTPDAFYDIGTPRYASLLERMRARGHEIGLHLSYHAYRSAEAMKSERERLEAASGAPVKGNRHHYWHLDPDDPHETLRRHVRAGLEWDSSLGFEMEPGFRRGVAHPFRPWDSEARAEMPLVEVPPTWMDDHFDRRTEVNGIAEPDVVANELLGGVARNGGVAVLDYHVRGMEPRAFPRYGRWLSRFLRERVEYPLEATTLQTVVDAYLAHEQLLARATPDEATVA